MPPSWMWPLDAELEHHFERVKVKRRNPGLDDDDDEPGLTIRNEYARGRGRQR